MAFSKANKYGYKEPSFLGSVVAAITYAAIFTIMNLSIAIVVFKLL